MAWSARKHDRRIRLTDLAEALPRVPTLTEPTDSHARGDGIMLTHGQPGISLPRGGGGIVNVIVPTDFFLHDTSSGSGSLLEDAVPVPRLDWAELTLEQKIGHGGVATVFKARWQGTFVAAK
eukprot:1897900-Prymnesium_polylepis.1